MTAKEYLQQYGDAVRVAERIKTEYQEELELICSIKSSLGGDGTPRGGNISKSTETKALRLADKATELQDAELEAIRIRQEVFDVIRKIPGEKGDVLYQRYINLKSWEEVADAVGYSVRQVHYLHHDGLEEIQHCIELHT